jgi:hypothetical protein
MADDTKLMQISVHVDEALLGQLEAAAKREIRSLSGKAAYRLRPSFEHPNDLVRVLNVRLDEPLRRQLTAEARRSVRSLNGEIIFRLRRRLDQQSEEAAS